MSRPEIIWLEDERTHAWLLSLGAYYSMVRYSKEGIDYEVLVSNDEIKYFEGEDADSDDAED